MVYEEIFDWFNQYKPGLAQPYGIFYGHLRNGDKVYVFDTIKNVAKRRTDVSKTNT